MTYQIEPMQQNDWKAVRAIFAEGIATGIASFAENAPEWEAWDDTYLSVGRLVARGNNSVLGWVALSKPYSH